MLSKTDKFKWIKTLIYQSILYAAMNCTSLNICLVKIQLMLVVKHCYNSHQNIYIDIL